MTLLNAVAQSTADESKRQHITVMHRICHAAQCSLQSIGHIRTFTAPASPTAPELW